MVLQSSESSKWLGPRLFLIGLLATLAMTAAGGVYAASAKAADQTRTEISCAKRDAGGFNCSIVVTNTTSKFGQNPNGTVEITRRQLPIPIGLPPDPAFTPNPCTLHHLQEVEAISGCDVFFSTLDVEVGTVNLTAIYKPESSTWAESHGQTTVLFKPQTFPRLSCGSPTVPVGQATTCTFTISQITRPNDHLPTGFVDFKDSHAPPGIFSPNSFCALDIAHPVDGFTTQCSVTFSSSTPGSRTITADYVGDSFHDPTSSATSLKVIVPNSTRFAKPGGTGADPCTNQANPCSLFTAASTLAPGTSVAPGQEVVLAPGTYHGAGDFGPSDAIVLEKGISLHGEAGKQRPKLEFDTGGLGGIEDRVSDIEVESVRGSSALSFDVFHQNNTGSLLDEVVARTAADGAITCSVESGNLRDSVCISTGANATALRALAFKEGTATFEQKFRNVTAVSTGTQSLGLTGEILNFGAGSPTLNVNAKSVIAKGTKADVAALTPTVDGNNGNVHINFDHSDYSSTFFEQGGGSLTITPNTPPGTDTNITADPALAADHYHETALSPTRDKGVVDGNSGVHDVDGEARVQGTVAGVPSPDIGADEIITPNATETTLSCQETTLLSRETTQCSATVVDKEDQAAGRPLAGGKVNFTDTTQGSAFPQGANCTLKAVTATEAKCETEVPFTPTQASTHNLEAEYQGDNGAHGKSKKALTVTVNQPTPTITAVDPAHGTVAGGTQVTITGTDLTAATAVSFGAIPATNFNVQGATTAIATAPAGAASSTVDIRITTPGGTSPISAADHYTYDPLPTQTTLACNPTTLILGAGASQCTATVQDTTQDATHPGGEVKLEAPAGAGAFSATSCSLPNNGQTKVSCQVIAFTPAKAGASELKASYQGDGTHAKSIGVVKLTVNASTPPGGAAPETILQKKPRKKTAGRKAMFKFASDQPGSTFQCKLDKKPFKPCSSPYKIKKLRPGRHTFQVKAINSQGIADPTPATFKWQVRNVGRARRH